MTGRSGSVAAGGATIDTVTLVAFLESNRGLAGCVAERQLTIAARWFKRDGSLAPVQQLTLDSLGRIQKTIWSARSATGIFRSIIRLFFGGQVETLPPKRRL